MVDVIINVLTNKYGYMPSAAKTAALHLINLKHNDLKKAVAEWLKTGVEIGVGDAPYDTVSLMQKHKLKYPAAVIFVGWYRENPDAAIQSISHWGGD